MRRITGNAKCFLPLPFGPYFKGNGQNGVSQGVLWTNWRSPFFSVAGRDHNHTRKRSKLHNAASAHHLRCVGTAPDRYF